MKKAPRNYSQDMDRRRQGLDAIVGKLNSIPDPTTEDEGKVLKVNDKGNYSLLPDGGAQTITVAITYDSEQDEYSADKTHTEIIAAIATGVIVTATYDGRTYVYAGKNRPSAFDAVYFSYLQADSDDQFIGKIFEIDEDDRITYSEHDLNNENVLPAVTSSDANTLLQVNSYGQWAKGLKIPELPKIRDDMYTPIQLVLLTENGTILAVPRVQLSSITKTTIDNDGYYIVTTCNVSVITDLRNGYTNGLKPTDFDNLNICGATSLYVNLALNDGINDFTLIGNTNCINGAVLSSNQSRLVLAFQECFLEERSQLKDIYKPYDVTLTYNNDVDNPDRWTLKFKLEKITTT